MADLVDGIRSEFGRRNDRLRPLVGELERLQRAVATLARTGTRALPGVGSPAATGTTRPRADGSAGAKPAAREASRKRRR